MTAGPDAGPAIALVGAPGSGKSTVGPLLARRLGIGFVDVDAVIQAAAGKTVQEIFADDGEPAFRALEVEHTLAQLGHRQVVSLGGGAVMSAPIRAALAEVPVVWLRVSAGKAAQRVGLNTARPLLLGNVRATLVKLLNERTPVYAEVADVTIDTDTLTPFVIADQIADQLADQIADQLADQPGDQLAGRDDQLGDRDLAPAGTPAPVAAGVVPVRTERPYEVWVGRGTVDRLGELVGGATRAAVVHPRSVAPLAQRCAGLLRAAGAEPLLLEVPDAEQAKTADVLVRCWNELAEAGFTRSDLVVGVGGGATTDLAGFVAASWLRGVRLVNVPTTVLGMVDAAVGGKTGINLDAGKNLVGAFHEPAGVLVDLENLAELPVPDLRGGLAEVIKAGFILDPAILELVEADPDACLRWDSEVLAELITRSIAAKARVVSGDLREATSIGDEVGRELLNYGHTLGHAIERREHFRWRHGEAVSVGMVFVAELARLAGKLDDETAARHARVLASVGLPTSYDPDALPDLLAGMALDKKTRGATLRFVVLNGLASAEILAGPDPDLVERAYRAVAAG